MSKYKFNAITLIALLAITGSAYAAPPPWQLGPVSGQLCATLDAILAGEIMNISTLAAFKNKEFDADKTMSLLMQTQQYIQQRHVDSARSMVMQNMEPGDRAFAIALLPQLLTVYQKCDLWISRFTMSKPENVSDADYATMENYCKTEPQNLHKNYCVPPEGAQCTEKGTRVGKKAWREFTRAAGSELCTKLADSNALIQQQSIDNPLTPCDDVFNDAVGEYVGEQVEHVKAKCPSPHPPLAPTSCHTTPTIGPAEEIARCCLSWTFGRTNGDVIASDIRLQSNGTISGYYNYNESSWGIDEGNIVFINGGGEIASRFKDVRIVGGHMFLTSQSWGSFAHTLRCN